MEELLVSRGKSLPDDDEEDGNRRTESTMACIAATKPDITYTEAAACIARGFVEEHPDCYATLQVDEDALRDVSNAGEAQKIAAFMAAVEAVMAKNGPRVWHPRPRIAQVLQEVRCAEVLRGAEAATALSANKRRKQYYGDKPVDRESCPVEREY